MVGVGVLVTDEVGVGEAFGVLGPDLAEVLVATFVAFVPIPIVGIRDDGVELVLVAGFEVGLAVVVGIGEELLVFVEVISESGGLGFGGCLLKEFAEDPPVLPAFGDVGGGDDLVGSIGETAAFPLSFGSKRRPMRMGMRRSFRESSAIFMRLNSALLGLSPPVKRESAL